MVNEQSLWIAFTASTSRNGTPQLARRPVVHKICCKLQMYFSIFVGIIAAALTYTLTGPNLISAKRAKAMIRAGTISRVIDVRTSSEFKAGHYPGAIHIPIGTISRASTKNLPRDGGILAYCNSGQRARYAAEKLEGLGFKNVFYIAGPYTGLM